jgi:hypothetical protein
MHPCYLAPDLEAALRGLADIAYNVHIAPFFKALH